MKILVLLFAALLVAGCGLESASESAEPSADTAKPIPAEPPAAESPSEEPSDTPKSLSDADVVRLLKEAVELDSLQYRDGLHYQINESEPYSGWAKTMYDSGQASRLGRFKDGKHDGLWVGGHENGQREREATFKDGKPHGPMMVWHENGQKEYEGVTKDGNADGLWTYWHENGQRKSETTFKDGKELSAKYWNSKGEEVETLEEARK